jgi:hypothetical protein
MHVLDRGMTKRGGETKDVKPFQGQCKNTHCLLKPRVRPGKYLYRQIYSEGQCDLGCVSLIVAHPSPAIKSSLIPVAPSNRRSSQSRHQVVAHPSPAIKSSLIPVPPSSRRSSQSRHQVVAHPSPAIKSSLIPVAPSNRCPSQSRHQIRSRESEMIPTNG